ncbi:hypothetical protein BDV97DRAFT_351630 [Delphinella strobiligena]|nr:hypothetical protein BDV97DRAFT_351630 [Delphinella strobiligena]
MAEDHDSLYTDDGHGIYERHDSHEAHDNHEADDRCHHVSLDSSSATTDTTDSSVSSDEFEREEQDGSQSQIEHGMRQAMTIPRHHTASPMSRIHYSPPSRHQHQPRDSYSGTGGRHLRSFSGLKDGATPSTPPSRRTSLRSSRLSAPTTFIPTKQDRLRYSWQSIIDDDEPSKPRIHVIKIVSTASTAAAGIGQEEAFGFSCSNRGKRIAVYNSARLFVLQTAALPVNVSQEYALKRRPLAVEIVDDENILAVLADEHTVNIYDTSHTRLRRLKTVRPDHPTYTIALSQTGALLAAAYEGGVEIFSLAVDALSTDRRAIRSTRMDKLTFSDDGSTLLGTTTRLHASSTVVCSVPLFPAAANGVATHDELKVAWCTGLLSPDNIRNSSHATFWRERGQLCNEKVFAWNALEDAFGIMHTPDLEYGNIACPLGVSQPLAVVGGLGAAIHSTPAVDESGCSVAIIVNATTVRIYTIPQNVDEDDSRVEAHSLDHELNDEYGCPFQDVCWVHTHKAIAPPVDTDLRTRGRLIVTSPGGIFDPNLAEQSVQDIEGGRIIIFDFDPQYAAQPGQLFTFTLGKAPPQMLNEEDLDVATEVDLVRRRTVTQSRNAALGQRPPSLGRTATTSSRLREFRSQEQTDRPSSPWLPSIQNTPIQEHAPNHLFSHLRGSRRDSLSLISLSSEASRSLPDLLEATDRAYEEPYTQAAPRSRQAIQRAATNANRLRFQALEERAAESSHPDGVPLPIYSETANQPLPAKFRKLAGLDIPDTGRRLYNREVATAPPTIPEQDSYFPLSHSPGTTPTLSNPRPDNMQRLHQNASTVQRVSPVNPGLPHSSMDQRGKVSPLMSRGPAQPSGQNLRHQSSWETVSTRQGMLNYPLSPESQSPISPTTTSTTEQSFDMRSPPLPSTTLRFQHPPLDFHTHVQSRPLDEPPEIQQEADATTHPGAPSNFLSNSTSLSISFRHSLLLPFDSHLSPTGSRPPSAASTTAARSPVNTHNTNANGHANSYYRTLSQRQTPFQRAVANSTNGRGNLADVVAGAVPSKGVSAGSVPHPITGWYPPASSASPSRPPVPSISESQRSGLSNIVGNGAGSARASTVSREVEPQNSEEALEQQQQQQRPDLTSRAYSAPLSSFSTPHPASVPGTPTDTGIGVTVGTTTSITSNDKDGPTAYERYFASNTNSASVSRNNTVKRPSAAHRSQSVGGRSLFAGRLGSKKRARTPLTAAGLEALEASSATSREPVQTREEFREQEGEAKRCVVM